MRKKLDHGPWRLTVQTHGMGNSPDQKQCRISYSTRIYLWFIFPKSSFFVDREGLADEEHLRWSWLKHERLPDHRPPKVVTLFSLPFVRDLRSTSPWSWNPHRISSRTRRSEIPCCCCDAGMAMEWSRGYSIWWILLAWLCRCVTRGAGVSAATSGRAYPALGPGTNH